MDKPITDHIEPTDGAGARAAAAAALARSADDPLLACLVFVARELGKPVSTAAVLAGLPLKGERLTPDLFERAAERLGLNARLVERRIDRIPNLVAPFIILYESGDAAVVVAKAGQEAHVVFPSVSDESGTVPISELEAEASGLVFYVASDEARVARQEMTGASARPQGHWLWSAVRRFWPSWIQIVFAAMIINLLGLALPLFVMNVYDRVIPNLAIPTLWALAAGVTLAVVFDFLLKQLRAVVLERTGRRVDISVAASRFEHALGISQSERPGSSGAIANQIREFELVRDFFTSSSIIAVTDLLFIGIFIAVLWLIVGPLAYVPLIAVPVVLIATLLIQVPLSRAVKLTQSQAARRHGILVEGLIGVETIKAVAGEGVMQRRWEDAVAATARASSSTKFWSSLAIYFTAMVQQAVSVIMIVWGVFLVSEGTITIGGLIAANILAGRVLGPLGNIAMTVARAQQAFAAMHAITGFVNLKREQDGEIAGGQKVEHGDVEFRDVSFSYPDGSGPALDSVSFNIKAGQRVGVLGRIGSGKTTMGKLLAGFYVPDQGAVLVDGANLERFERADLRAGVGFLGQEPELFAGTLRDNVTLGKPNATEHEIAEAVRLSGVEAFTDAHPLGLAMPIGERGRGLSGGQRQAVALARILLRKPRILFLDEPSGAMDTVTEAALINNLRRLADDGVTMIICTHRTSFLDLVDQLIVVEAGKIMAYGPKADVLKALEAGAQKRRDMGAPTPRAGT